MCDKQEDYSQTEDIFNLKEMKESLAIAESLARTAMMTSPAAKRRLAARKLEMGLANDSEYVPPKHLLLYIVRMGSFTFNPVTENVDQADEDVLDTFNPTTISGLVYRCQQEINNCEQPGLLKRSMAALREDELTDDPATFRVLQWNLLSQTLAVHQDNFVATPKQSLHWPIRRFYILQEIIQHTPDVVCLEEVDHFRFLASSLGSVGYVGKFLPKPDSPCIYLEGNNGPDGAAVFYRADRFELVCFHTRVLEVWHVKTNQVCLVFILRDKHTNQEICVAATHLKAKRGSLLAMLRNNQGKDLLDWLQDVCQGRPVVLCGDFNAEPNEAVYSTTLSHSLSLRSAYSVFGSEPEYTSWKIREEGEICHTIDYIFHSKNFIATRILTFPDEEEIGPGRIPSLSYPSDHFSLIADFILKEGDESECNDFETEKKNVKSKGDKYRETCEGKESQNQSNAYGSCKSTNEKSRGGKEADVVEVVERIGGVKHKEFDRTKKSKKYVEIKGKQDRDIENYSVSRKSKESKKERIGNKRVIGEDEEGKQPKEKVAEDQI